jgi:hypothetical protein
MRVRSTFEEGAGTLIGPLADGFSPPDFIGLSNCLLPDGSSKLTAVFATGKGFDRAKTVMDLAAASDSGATALDSRDPDAIAFACPAKTAAGFARSLFAVLEA